MNITDMHSSTMLHEAARSGSLECCDLFFIDINVVNKKGDTPIYMVSLSFRRDITSITRVIGPDITSSFKLIFIFTTLKPH